MSKTNSNIYTLNSLLAAVPEPGVWAMMILGFGLSGSVNRHARRRRARPLS